MATKNQYSWTPKVDYKYYASYKIGYYDNPNFVKQSTRDGCRLAVIKGVLAYMEKSQKVIPRPELNDATIYRIDNGREVCIDEMETKQLTNGSVVMVDTDNTKPRPNNKFVVDWNTGKLGMEYAAYKNKLGVQDYKYRH